MAKEATVTVTPEPYVREGLVYHIYQGIIPVYQGTWQVQEIQTTHCCSAVADAFPLPGAPLIVNSSIQFRRNLERRMLRFRSQANCTWTANLAHK